MNKRVLKFKGLTGRYNTSSFIFTENEPLVIGFEFTEHRLGKYVADVVCGSKKMTVALDGKMEIKIRPEFIVDGGFEPIYIYLSFLNYIGDKIIICNDPAKGGFFVEPLYIVRTNESTTGQAWLDMVEKIIADLTARVEAAENRLKQFEDDGVPLIVSKDN